jgi:hypothetical protein
MMSILQLIAGDDAARRGRRADVEISVGGNQRLE